MIGCKPFERRNGGPILLTAAIFVGFLIYALGIKGPFLLDDYSNLEVLSWNGGADTLSNKLAFVFGRSGDVWERSISRASFLLNINNWPAPQHWIKLTNVIIHALCAISLFFLALEILKLCGERRRASGLASVIAIVWFIHPMQVSTVLYAIQRMTELMTLFFFLALLFFMRFRMEGAVKLKFLYFSLFAIFSIFSVLSKENGIVILVIIFLLEIILIRDSEANNKDRWAVLTGSTAIFFFALYTYICVSNSATYEGRVFTVLERISVQGYVLFEYIKFWFVPEIQGMTIYHDDLEWILVGEGLGYKYLFWILHFIALIFAIYFYRRKPVVSFAIFFFYCGQIIESTFFPLELMFEHRNYAPSAGLTILMVVALSAFSDKVASQKKFYFSTFAAFFIGVCTILLTKRVLLWSDEKILKPFWASEHPYSLRSQTDFVKMLDKNGMSLLALDTAKMVNERFDTLALRMYGLGIHCRLFPEETDKGLVIDVSKTKGMKYSSGVIHELENLARLKESCLSRHLSGGGLFEFLASIETMELLIKKPPYYARYLDVFAKVSIKERRYADALRATEKLSHVQPTIDAELKLAELYLIGGLFEDAKLALDRAKQKNNKSFLKNRNYEESIDNLAQILNQGIRQSGGSSND